MSIDNQVLYQGRWVSRDHFRTFVYNQTGQRLVNSYDEFSEAVSSGTWFADLKDVPKSTEKVVSIKSEKGAKCQSQQPQ